MHSQLINRLKQNYNKMIWIPICLGVIVFLMVWVRAFYGSMTAYYKGASYLKDKKYIRAITFFDRSIHWYTPFNPYVDRSAERLWNIGKYAEQKGDTKLALIAFRTIRRGFYSTHSFYKPGREWINRCDTQINQLMGPELQNRETHSSSGKKGGFITKRQKDPSPKIFWTILLEIGFLGWVGSVIGFIMFPLRRKEENQSLTSSFLVWIGLTIVFFAFWIFGMMKA